MDLQTLSRREVLNLLAISGGASLTSAPAMAGLAAAPAPENEIDEIAWALLAHFPEAATALGIDTGGQADLRYRLEDRSPEGRTRIAAMLQVQLKRLRARTTEPSDPITMTSLAVVETAFSSALEGLALPYGDVAVGGWRNTPYVVIQNVGSYLDVPRFLAADHPVRSADDAEAYLSRLRQMPQQLDGELERLRSAARFGLIPPDFLLDRTIAQMTSTLVDARNKGGPLVISLARRTWMIPGDWKARARAVVSDEIIPALERQLAELEKQRSRASSAPGIGARPDGEAFYAWALTAATTTRLTPDEVHELGQEQLAELHERMEPILRSLGYDTGSVGTRMATLARDRRFMFAQGDAGRAEIMAEIGRRIEWIRAQMPRAFRNLASGAVEVLRLPAAEEPGAPAAYGGPGSIDGTIPGRMWINLRTTDLHRRYDLPTLVHHETIPGHVWQGEYANRLPLIRTLLSFNAYSEGWALYAEQLADELGAYADDPVGQLGYLQSLAFRACRMVVDTGLHVRGWSRERAIDFFVTRNGNKREEVESEVDRYCSWPGQACGYKIGHSEMVRQRSRAKARLGTSFDLRDFNQAVVDGGNVPLNVLAGNVSRYIEKVLAG